MSPDWVCEVLSPSTNRVDRIKKLPLYALNGVQHVWLVDPEQKTLELLRLNGSHCSLVGLYEGEASVSAEPFDAIVLNLADLWPSSSA